MEAKEEKRNCYLQICRTPAVVALTSLASDSCLLTSSRLWISSPLLTPRSGFYFPVRLRGGLVRCRMRIGVA